MRKIILTAFVFCLIVACNQNKKEKCDCEFVKKENCDGKGNCDYTFKCTSTGKEVTEAGTEKRAKELCMIDCCN